MGRGEITDKTGRRPPVGIPGKVRKGSIAARLRARGITQAALADELGVSQGSVSLAANGRQQSWRIQTAIAKRLGSTVEKLWPAQVRLRRNQAQIAPMKNSRWKVIKLHELHSRGYSIGLFIDAKEGAETEVEKQTIDNLAQLFHRLGDKLWLAPPVYEHLRMLADRCLPDEHSLRTARGKQ